LGGGACTAGTKATDDVVVSVGAFVDAAALGATVAGSFAAGDGAVGTMTNVVGAADVGVVVLGTATGAVIVAGSDTGDGATTVGATIGVAIALSTGDFDALATGALCAAVAVDEDA
jgi:hypothetical protein